jgi:hypothetical protein
MLAGEISSGSDGSERKEPDRHFWGEVRPDPVIGIAVRFMARCLDLVGLQHSAFALQPRKSLPQARCPLRLVKDIVTYNVKESDRGGDHCGSARRRDKPETGGGSRVIQGVIIGDIGQGVWPSGGWIHVPV